MSQLQLPAEQNASVVAASLVEDDLRASQYPSLSVASASPVAEVISLGEDFPEKISVGDGSGAGVQIRSPSQLTIQSLVKTKDAKLLDHESEQLMDMGFPRGLALEMGTTRSLFPIRFWIVDNSGSMLSA